MFECNLIGLVLLSVKPMVSQIGSWVEIDLLSLVWFDVEKNIG